MEIPVSKAKAQLTELVRRAAAGDDVVLTRHGHAAARLVAVATAPDRERRAALETAGRRKARPGPCAARSQDFLYGDSGLPG